MAKKKKFKLTKKQQQNLRKRATFAGILLIGVLSGIVIHTALSRRPQPHNLVWAADKTVTIPKDLQAYLEQQNGCEHYRGQGSPTGIGLWGVYQVSHGKFAKISYGCSGTLTNYIMAVKTEKTWQLVPTTEYFAPFKDGVNASKGALPYCTQIAKYKIDKTIEPFCINTDGSAQANDQM